MAESSIIESLRAKIGRLIADHRRLKGEHAALLDAQKVTMIEKRELLEKIDKLERKLKVVELKDGLTYASGDPKVAKARINNLLREIDKCIAMINSD